MFLGLTEYHLSNLLMFVISEIIRYFYKWISMFILLVPILTRSILRDQRWIFRTYFVAPNYECISPKKCPSHYFVCQERLLLTSEKSVLNLLCQRLKTCICFSFEESLLFCTSQHWFYVLLQAIKENDEIKPYLKNVFLSSFSCRD